MSSRGRTLLFRSLKNKFHNRRKKLTSFLIFLSLVFLFTATAYSTDHGNTTNQSFSKAKKTLERQVYYDHRITFYCGCPFTAEKDILPCDNYTPMKRGETSITCHGNILSRPMPLVKAFRNGEMVTQTV